MADSGLTKLKSIFGFGDDLGFDGYDPEGGPITKLVKKQQEQSS